MKNKIIPKIDLLIIDIDDAFIYHRTVAAANRIFLKEVAKLFSVKTGEKKLLTTAKAFTEIFKIVFANFFRIRLGKKNLCRLYALSVSALSLHILNVFRELSGCFGGGRSNRKMIMLWADTVKKLNLKYGDYLISKRTLKANLYPEMIKAYKKIRKENPNAYVAAISQNFSIDGKKDPIIDLLGIDFMKTNSFRCSKGFITGYDIDVADSHDKKSIAEAIIRKRRPKGIGLIMDDYEDLGLLELKNLKLVVYTKKIERFIDKNKYIAVKVDV